MFLVSTQNIDFSVFVLYTLFFLQKCHLNTYDILKKLEFLIFVYFYLVLITIYLTTFHFFN